MAGKLGSLAWTDNLFIMDIWVGELGSVPRKIWVGSLPLFSLLLTVYLMNKIWGTEFLAKFLLQVDMSHLMIHLLRIKIHQCSVSCPIKKKVLQDLNCDYTRFLVALYLL